MNERRSARVLVTKDCRHQRSIVLDELSSFWREVQIVIECLAGSKLYVA